MKRVRLCEEGRNKGFEAGCWGGGKRAAEERRRGGSPLLLPAQPFGAKQIRGRLAGKKKAEWGGGRRTQQLSSSLHRLGRGAGNGDELHLPPAHLRRPLEAVMERSGARELGKWAKDGFPKGSVR